MLISAVQQIQIYIYIHTHIYIYAFFLYISFHDGLSQNIEYSFLCHTVALLPIHSICNSLHLLIPNSQSIPPLTHPSNQFLVDYGPKCVKVKVKPLSCIQLFATPWTVAYQAPPSMGFSRQEYWSGLPFPSLNV